MRVYSIYLRLLYKFRKIAYQFFAMGANKPETRHQIIMNFYQQNSVWEKFNIVKHFLKLGFAKWPCWIQLVTWTFFRCWASAKVKEKARKRDQKWDGKQRKHCHMKVVEKKPNATFTKNEIFLIIFLLLQAVLKHKLKFLSE